VVVVRLVCRRLAVFCGLSCSTLAALSSTLAALVALVSFYGFATTTFALALVSFVFFYRFSTNTLSRGLVALRGFIVFAPLVSPAAFAVGLFTLGLFTTTVGLCTTTVGIFTTFATFITLGRGRGRRRCLFSCLCF